MQTNPFAAFNEHYDKCAACHDGAEVCDIARRLWIDAFEASGGEFVMKSNGHCAQLYGVQVHDTSNQQSFPA